MNKIVNKNDNYQFTRRILSLLSIEGEVHGAAGTSARETRVPADTGWIHIEQGRQPGAHTHRHRGLQTGIHYPLLWSCLVRTVTGGHTETREVRASLQQNQGRGRQAYLHRERAVRVGAATLSGDFGPEGPASSV